MGGIKGALVPALIGGAGAVALDYIWGYTAPYLPAQLQSGYVGTVAKAGVALGAGWLASKVVSKQMAMAGVVGAVTVIAYQLLHQMIAGTASTGVAPAAVPGGVSAYMPRRGMGWMSPGSTLGAARFGAYMPTNRAPAGAASLVARPGGGVNMSGLAYAGGT